jgi:phosphohistidine phosphatase
MQGIYPMKLILVRHAAASERTDGVLDEKRYLTPEGRVFFRKTARTMLKNGIDPSLILTSPLLRAVQTAEILAETLSFSGPLVVTDELAPGFDMPALQRLFSEFQSVNELVLVGHEPDFSSLIDSLLNLPAGFNFKKGAAIKLKLDPADLQTSAAFKWLAAGKKLVTAREEALAS